MALRSRERLGTAFGGVLSFVYDPVSSDNVIVLVRLSDIAEKMDMLTECLRKLLALGPSKRAYRLPPITVGFHAGFHVGETRKRLPHNRKRCRNGEKRINSD